MTDEIHSTSEITDETLEGMLRRALRITLIIGTLAALILWKAAGWRNAAMMATGAAISAASILEWRRLARMITAAFSRNQVPRGAVLGVSLFLLRLAIFAAAIYVSLKCFQGSVLALLCGLGLALLAIVWEALRLLRE
ncbi:MAG TPA: hypothetical protein VGR47_22785 [Terracidiphilus sp.]|nr:hypothetical protein [Terracidiphilus sp.]